MSVLSDLVPGTEADIEKIALAEVPSQIFGGIDIKGIDPVKIGRLHSILSGKEFKALMPEYSPVHSVSEDGPWVFLIPEFLTTKLAALSAEQRDALAKQWASTEEFALDGWGEDDVAVVLEAMRSLASSTVASNKSLFLWMSL